ncbi:hypothetical protein C7256_01590 [Enterocloster lavalensis]|nr:hypothetical protein C7256_01590 [Enterocloster lavalensis]
MGPPGFSALRGQVIVCMGFIILQGDREGKKMGREIFLRGGRRGGVAFVRGREMGRQVPVSAVGESKAE